MSLTQNAAPVFIPSQVEPADSVAYAAHPLLARLTSALRAPLLPMIGFAELCAGEATPAQRQAWAAEILAASRQHLAMLDCTLALAAGRPPTISDAATLATAAAAVGALRSLLHPEAPMQDYHH